MVQVDKAVLGSTQVEVPSVLKKPLKIDIAFSGMFYVLVDTSRLRAVMGNSDNDDLPEMVPENGKFYAKLGAEIRKAAAEHFPVKHPVILWAAKSEICNITKVLFKPKEMQWKLDFDFLKS